MTESIGDDQEIIFVYKSKDVFLGVPRNITHVIVDDTDGSSSSSAVSTMIPARAFAGSSYLATVTLPPFLREIGEMAFIGCAALRSIQIPLNVAYIGEYVFSECFSLVELKLPEGITVLPEGMCQYCSSLTRVIMPSTVEQIGIHAFAYCEDLSSIRLPFGLREIGARAFRNCTSLTNILIPSTVEKIEQECFGGCQNLVSVELANKNTLKVIESGAFTFCLNLVNVAVPLSVLEIEEAAFEDCDRIVNAQWSEERIHNVMRSRFDGFPVHELCYYQAHHEDDYMTPLNMMKEFSEFPFAVAVDPFGLTPFHILAMSTKPNPALFKELMASYPTNILCKRDNSKRSPMHYLSLNECNGLESVVRLLLQATVVEQLQFLGLRRWRSDIREAIGTINYENISERHMLIKRVYSKLAAYQRSESIALLEQALWKWKLKAAENDPHDEPNFEKRKICRINCGSDHVIPNVMPFLGKLLASEEAI